MSRVPRTLGYLAAALLINALVWLIGSLAVESPPLAWMAGASVVLLGGVVVADIVHALREARAARRGRP